MPLWTPSLPASAFTTYGIRAPRSTHFRAATCPEVDCPQYLHGWITRLDERTPEGQARATYVRTGSGRRFTEDRDPTGMTLFRFAPWQRCFDSARHMIRLDREPIYLRRGGDWRGDPTGARPYIHTRAEHWVEEFAENQARLATAAQRG